MDRVRFSTCDTPKYQDSREKLWHRRGPQCPSLGQQWIQPQGTNLQDMWLLKLHCSLNRLMLHGPDFLSVCCHPLTPQSPWCGVEHARKSRAGPQRMWSTLVCVTISRETTECQEGWVCGYVVRPRLRKSVSTRTFFCFIGSKSFNVAAKHWEHEVIQCCAGGSHRGVVHGGDRQTDGQRKDNHFIKVHCVRARLDKRRWIMDSYSKAGKHLGRFNSTRWMVPISGGEGAWIHFFLWEPSPASWKQWKPLLSTSPSAGREASKNWGWKV